MRRGEQFMVEDFAARRRFTGNALPYHDACPVCVLTGPFNSVGS
jgi:hypothetical protein